MNFVCDFHTVWTCPFESCSLLFLDKNPSKNIDLEEKRPPKDDNWWRSMDRHLIVIDLNLHEVLNGGDFGRFPWSHFELPTLHVQLPNYRRNSSKKQGFVPGPKISWLGVGFVVDHFFPIKKTSNEKRTKNNQPLGAPLFRFRRLSALLDSTWAMRSWVPGAQ